MSVAWLWKAASAMPWLAPLAKGRRAAVWSLAILLALAVGVAYQWPDLSEGHLPEAEGYYLRGDPDTALILKGVGESPRLVDTLDWWTGIWCGVVPFWRPIPSLLFWAEEKVFGYDFRGWAIVHVLLAGVLAAVMFWALEPLLGIDGAGSVVFMALLGLLLPWKTHPPLTPVLLSWKHHVDLLFGISLFVAVALIGGKRPLWALLPTGLACATKETGFVLLLLLPLIALWRRRRGDDGIAPLRLAGYMACLVIPLAIWRLIAVGYGFGMGTNMYWWVRVLMYYGGYPVQQVMTGCWYTFAAGVLIVATLWLAWRRPRLAVLSAPVALAVIVCALAAQRRIDIAVALTTLFVDGEYIFAAAWWCAMALAALRFSRHEVILGLAFMLLGSAPTFLATQTLEHGRWLGGVGHAILGWAAIRGVWIAAPMVWAAMKGDLQNDSEEGNRSETVKPPVPTETETKER